MPIEWEDASIIERRTKSSLIGRRNFLKRATLAGAVTLAPSLANAGSSDPVPDAPVKLHRIRCDQLYHYYLGDPIEVLLLRENGDSELVVVGPNIVGGELVQLFIPGNTFHTARITGKSRWFLGASTEWPGVVPSEDVELGDAEELAAKYPESAADIRKFPEPAEK